ncbi:alginate export family protein [Pseudoxanthomonas winnipegensis]|uniref:alginate export family protein n=1 Tax=Pseudoxanthomonas winnipegensis TaxID=2480810 RepID=UPI001F43D4CF|nr:alginate export family protein [Pseudoxanthomonas winnipegensis]
MAVQDGAGRVSSARRLRRLSGWAAMLAAGAAQAAGPQAKLLPYEEDYSALGAVSRTGWERLKYIPVGSGWLSLGGESRTLYDFRQDNGFGRFATDPHGYWQQRFRLWADYRPTPNFRLFGELASSSVAGLQTRPVQATDRNALDLAQGFVELSGDGAAPTWRLRAGRQQIAYAWQRLLDPRDPANSRMPFDALRVLYQRPGLSGGLLWGRPVQTRVGSFDDRSDDAQRLWGAHVEKPLYTGTQGAAKLEAIYLETHQNGRRYAGVVGEDHRQTLSTRFSGTYARWDYDLEMIGQRGHFAGQRVRAWQGSLFAGYSFDQAWKPRLGLRMEASSGDRRPGDGELNTFNGLYARASVFDGSMMTTNVRYFGPELVLRPSDKLWVDLYVLKLQRQSLHDGVYAAGWRVVQPGDANQARDIGVRKVMWVKYRFNDFASLDVYVHHTSAGAFLHEGTREGRDSFYVAPYLTLRF